MSNDIMKYIERLKKRLNLKDEEIEKVLKDLLEEIPKKEEFDFRDNIKRK